MNYPEFANRAILIDPRAATLAALAQSNLRRVHKPEQIFIVVDSALLKQTPNLHQGQEVIIGVDRLPEGSLDLKSALKQLFAHRVTSIFVEGGSLTHSQFLKQRLAQRLYLFSAPVIIGAGGGISWTQGFAIDHMRDRLQLNHPEFQQFGSDLMTTGRLEF
jgi:diaminohydroxyphosphoribosylaminopyrimidine deaminase/5-amino-6-(5-phosphoribosylamino)uracil reductase